MTLGFALTIQLSAGLHIEDGPQRLRWRGQLVWGRTECFVAHACTWELAQEKHWQHRSVWSLTLTQRQQSVYGLRLESRSQFPYQDLRLHRLRWQTNYGALQPLVLRHALAYGQPEALTRRFVTPYWLTANVRQHLPCTYSIGTTDPVRARLTLSWSVLAGARLQAVMNLPELVCAGVRIRIIAASLSCDEESPVWMAQIDVADRADFAAIAIGQTLSLHLGQETFVLVVDGKTLSRASAVEEQCTVTGVSPVAWLDAPFAVPRRYCPASALSAQAAVESLLGSVDWQLPAWIIPAGRLLFDGVTPLAAARQIVAAIGGIVESNPDGTLICRRRHPVRRADYETAVVAHSLFDADVLSARAQIAPMRGFNRVTIANTESSGSGSADDRIEYVPDANDPRTGTVRAYPGRERPLLLTHTGHPNTVITPLGQVTRQETETVECIEGGASTRYPVTAIISSTWLHADLGAVRAEGQNLTSATAGYSLLRISYTTTSLDWRVALAVDEEVQFVLVDV